MELLLQMIVIGVSIFLILLMFKINEVSLSFFKKNIYAIIVYFSIVVIIYFFLLCNISFLQKILDFNYLQFIDRYVLFMTSCGIGIIVSAPFINILQKIIENKKIKDLESRFIYNKYEYYRDVVGNIPPSILSIIYNRNINITDVIVASFIFLQEKNLLKVNNNKIFRTSNESSYSHENIMISYLIGDIKENDFNNIYEDALMNDLKKDGYFYSVSEKDKEEINMTEFMEIVVVWLIITLLFFMPVIIPLCNIGIILVFSYVFAFIGIPIYKFISKSINPIVRTEKTLELNFKLNGLKKFLTDFTIINDRSVSEIKLFEDYILYAIIFNMKGNLNDECNRIYENIIGYINNSKCS